MDSAVRLSPPTKFGERFIVVAVDVFMKWVEIGLLRDLDSLSVAHWFHLNITWRFGTPYCIRTDNGREFMGHFGAYLSDKGIKQVTTTPYHPRANGMVERYIGVLKSGIQRMKTAFPQG